MANLPIAPRKKFIFPPINEVVMALYHHPLMELRAQHIGMYWQSIRENFPLCQQQSPIMSAHDPAESFYLLAPTDSTEAAPLPRFWFWSNEHPNLIQLQRNAFILNWRKGKGKDTAYPHFETVEQEFWKEFKRYGQFLEGIDPQASIQNVQRCELTYINLIETNQAFQGPETLSKVLPALTGITGSHRAPGQLIGLNTIVVHRLTDNLTVDVNTKLGMRTEDRAPVAILEIKVHGAPKEGVEEAVTTWYREAHDAINKTFLSCTDADIQKEVWKFQT